MKRPASIAFSHHYGVGPPPISHFPLINKRIRVVSVGTENEGSETTQTKPRVKFSDTLVQTRQIPAIVDPNEKNCLFYSGSDFAKFAFQERIRRDTLIVTAAVSREQLRRLRRGAPIISPQSVTMMYYKILTRNLHNFAPPHDEVTSTKAKRNMIVAQAA